MQPPSATPPPPPRRGWWSRPIATMPAMHERDPNCKENTACLTPCCGGLFTVITIMVFFFYFIDNTHYHAEFTIQSIVVSPSATCHVDFLVKNPSSRYSIYYGDDETAVRLGPLNAAVLSTSYERRSPSHTAFSLDFAAEDNPNNVVVFEQLDIKLRALHKVNNAGYVDVRCYNLTRNHENVEKIQCHSSFTELKTFSGNPYNNY